MLLHDLAAKAAKASMVSCAWLALLSTGPAFAQPPADFSALAREQGPAVVAIMTRQQAEELALPPLLPEFFRRFGERELQEQSRLALGSGFVISPEGHIVTANHVVESAAEIRVTFANGSSVAAQLVGRDPPTDLAVLKIEPPRRLSVVRWGDSDAIEPGAWTVAIGSPFGLGGTVTVGVLSAHSRDLRIGKVGDLLQTDASINRGNSGGPLFNAGGEVIGVNTAILSPTGGHIGIGFAVPSNTARRVAQELIEIGAVQRGYLGAVVLSVTPATARALNLGQRRGALVARVQAGSPAARAGLQRGDLITQLGGDEIDSARTLTRMMRDRRPGARLPAVVWRRGRERSFTIVLGEHAPSNVP